jgi:hypothetical protein
MGDPMLQDRTILGIQNPIKSYVVNMACEYPAYGQTRVAVSLSANSTMVVEVASGVVDTL